MGLEVNVQIRSGSNIGGRFPFIVVCFDNDLSNEVYKTASSPGGSQVVWNDAFTLDLKTHFKRILTEGKKEPAYMTFFIFDNGVRGTPSLGSAGVRLSLVRDEGRVEGDFPVVNGAGTLNLSVEGEKSRFDWLTSDKAKFAAGAVGIGAVAAGLTAVALNQRKKKSAVERDDDPERIRLPHEGGERKKKMFDMSKIPGLRALTGDDNSGSSGDEGHERRLYREERYEARPDPRDSSGSVGPRGGRDVQRRVVEERGIGPRESTRDVGRRDGGHFDSGRHVDYVPPRTGYPVQPPHPTHHPQLGPHERPWWVELNDDDDDDGAPDYTNIERPARSVKPGYPPGGAFESRTEEPPASVHIHYHEGGNTPRAKSFEEDERDDETDLQPADLPSAGHQSAGHQPVGRQSVRVRVQEPDRTSEYIEERRVAELPEDLTQGARTLQNNPYI